MNRFKIKPNQYSDLGSWMRKNLTQYALNDLSDGFCAFNPACPLPGATKEVIECFCAAFKGEMDGAERCHICRWEEDGTYTAADWAGWTPQEQRMALLISDAMVDHANYDDVNVNACVDLTEDEDGIEDLKDMLIVWLDSDDKTLVKHARKVARMAGIDLSELV